jgi:hypothetical protein
VQQPVQGAPPFVPFARTGIRGLLERWFFVVVALLALITVAVGFAPTFYLRALGTEGLPPALQRLPAYLHFHGIVLTAWFLLYLLQAVLVATDRRHLHRRIGVVGAFVAVAVAVSTLYALQQQLGGRVRPSFPPVVFFINVAVVVQFSVLVALAIRFRLQPEKHKRLMYLAMTPLVGAAVSRYPGVGAAIAFAPAPSMWLALILWDLAVNRRPHRATLWGIAVCLVSNIVIGFALGLSDLGRVIAQALT